MNLRAEKSYVLEGGIIITNYCQN